MRCVETLLKAGAAMTMEQLTVVIHALPTLQDPKVLILFTPAGYRMSRSHPANVSQDSFPAMKFMRR